MEDLAFNWNALGISPDAEGFLVKSHDRCLKLLKVVAKGSIWSREYPICENLVARKSPSAEMMPN